MVSSGSLDTIPDEPCRQICSLQLRDSAAVNSLRPRCFNGLPEELLDNICSLFDTPTNPEEYSASKETLCNLCLVSQELYRIAKPYLYRTVTISFSLDVTGRTTRNGLTFMRTITRSKYLGEWVQSLRVELRGYFGRIYPGTYKEFLNSLVQIEKDLHRTLAHLPKLSHLDLGQYHILKDPFQQPVGIENIYTYLHLRLPFSSLHSCSICPGGSKSTMYANLSTLSIRPGRRTMAELFPMFELPTLETLHLDLDNIEPYSNIFLGERVVKEHWNKLKSNVRHISIRILDYSSLYRRPQIARLDLLSSACPLLTSFRFWVRYHARLYDYLYASIYEAFSKQLLTGNLKDIDTSTGSTANWFGRGSPPPPIEPIPPTILQSWQLPKTQLQSLTLDLPWLMRDLANVVPPLPSTLECLTLRYTPDWYNNPGNNATDPMTVELGSGRFSRALTKIAKGFQASLPRLRQLRVVVLPQLLPLAGMVGRTCWEEDEYLRAFVNLSIREPDDGDYYHGKGF